MNNKSAAIHVAPTVHVSASYRYEQHYLFQNFNLTLPAGQWTCLLGPSGVGKTTLLRIIAGLINTQDSAIAITTSDQLPLSTRLSFMAQDDLLLPWLTALQNVLIGFQLRGEKKQLAYIKPQAEQLLVQVGLKDHQHKRPEELSGGQRQRVALVRTLIENHPVVLMDEPFASLDAITRLQLQELAAQLLKKRTVLLITHDPLEALRLGDHIYVLQGSPVRLSDVIQPPGIAPRVTTDLSLLKLQAELLSKLAGDESCVT